MHLECPHCGFNKTVDDSRLTAGMTRATCPKCGQSFALPSIQLRVEPETPQPEIPVATVSVSAILTQPKAGFWLRLVAATIDGIIVFMLQFVLGALLVFAGFMSSLMADGQIGNLSVLIQIFGYVLGTVYAIFFIGYCGQTPGKMALHIKVVGIDGSQISYGRAALREVVGKFLSGILLCIGYLMIAFDEQKQSLHDRLAKTYVIKL